MQPGLVTPRSSVEPRPSLLDGFADDLCRISDKEVGVEERERQSTVTRPKTMAVLKVGFSRFAGRTLPSGGSEPSP